MCAWEEKKSQYFDEPIEPFFWWHVFLHIFFFFLCKRRPFSYIIIYTYYTLVSIYKRPSYTRCVFGVGSRVKNKTRAQFSITRTPIYCVLWWFFYPIFILFNVQKTSLVNDCEKLIGVWYKRARAYTRIDVLEDFYRFFFYVISKNSSRGLAVSMRVNGGFFSCFLHKKTLIIVKALKQKRSKNTAVAWSTNTVL